jgi:FKBP12-rapamycin complex-associated protein
MASAFQEVMEAIFTDLKSNNDAFRRNAAGRLLSQVQAAFRELHPAEFNTFYADVNNSMVKLILNGVDTHQRTGGFYAMSALIDFKGDEAGQKVTRFCGYIRRTLEGNDTSTMVVAANSSALWSG